MRYRFFVLVLLAVMLILVSSCSVITTLSFTERDIKDSPNLVQNNSFSPYSTIGEEALKSWMVILNPQDNLGSPVNIDPENALEGKTSLRIDASNKSVLILSEPFNVRRYGGYYLRCYFKTNCPNPPRPQLRFIVFKENGKIVNHFKIKSNVNNDWQRSTISAGFIKPGAKFGRLGIYIPPFKEGSIWIDDTGCFEVHGFKID
ncbi:MAG: hypothetical protein ABFC98_03175 [Candidatus Cloacimonas sp.]